MPFLERAGVRIFYEVDGTGPTVILHTGAGGDGRIWSEAGYVRGLSEFKTIRIDQRGRGRSGRPSSVDAHRVEEFVEDVAAVLDDAGVESAGFWGYSNGILVGIGLAGSYPKRLKALVGTGAIRYRNLSELPPVDEAKEMAETIAGGGVRAEVDRREKSENDRFPAEIDRNVRSGDPTMDALDGVAWLKWHGPKAVLDRTRFPILFLTGEREDPDRNTERTVSLVPTARVVRIPGVGHLGVFYRSDLSLPHALPFLRENVR